MSASLVTRNGQRNSFHGPMKVSRTAVSSAGSHQRQRDRPQDAELAGAVEPGRGEQLLGQLQEELPEDEHRGGVDRERQDHPEVGVGQPVGAHDHHVDAG